MIHVQTYERTDVVREALLNVFHDRCPKMQWEAQVVDDDALTISATADLNGHIKSWQWYYELHLPVSVKLIQLQAERIISECIMDMMWWLKEEDMCMPDDTGVV